MRKTKELFTLLGMIPEAKEGIANLHTLPSDTKVVWDHTPDGSTDQVNIPVTVITRIAIHYEVIVIALDWHYDLTDHLADLPSDIQVQDITAERIIDMTKAGTYKGCIQIVYVDDSNISIVVNEIKEQANKGNDNTGAKTNAMTFFIILLLSLITLGTCTVPLKGKQHLSHKKRIAFH